MVIVMPVILARTAKLAAAALLLGCLTEPDPVTYVVSGSFTAEHRQTTCYDGAIPIGYCWYEVPINEAFTAVVVMRSADSGSVTLNGNPFGSASLAMGPDGSWKLNAEEDGQPNYPFSRLHLTGTISGSNVAGTVNRPIALRSAKSGVFTASVQ